MSRLWVVLILLSALPQTTSSRQTDQTVLRVGVNEVLVDVVVTDRKGKQIRDLRSEDFEIYEDGKLQKVVSFRTPEPEGESQLAAAPTAALPKIVATGAMAGISGARRMGLVAMVFDRLSPPGRKLASDAALQYVREFGATEYVSVMVIDRKLRVLTPFTTSQEQLSQAITLVTGGTPQQFLDASRTVRDAIRRYQEASALAAAGVAAAGQGNTPGPGLGASFAEAAFNRSIFTMMRQTSVAEEAIQGGVSVEALMQIVRSLREFAGRKSVMFFAEQMTLPSQVVDRMRDLQSAANRANVSFYCIDTAGLDSTRRLERMGQELATLSQVSQQQQAKSGREAVSRDEVMLAENVSNVTRSVAQENLADLAASTGGTLVANTNDLKRGIRNVVDDFRFHYELTFVPANQNYDGSFRKLEVKVKRSGALVRSREGYYAFARDDTDARHEAALFAALNANPAPKDLSFRSAALRFPTAGPLSDAVLYSEIPLAGLTFSTNQQKKEYNARLAVLMVVRSEQGRVVEKFSQDLPLQGPAEKSAETSQKSYGFYRLASIAPGRYTVETAVRDAISGKTSVERSSLTIPGRNANEFTAGSIVLVKYLDELAADADLTDSPLIFGKKMIIPTLSAEIEKTENAALAFFVLAAGPANAAATADILLAKDGKSLGHTGEQKLPEADSRGMIPYMASLPVGSFPPGSYELEVIFRQGSSTASSKTTFVLK